MKLRRRLAILLAMMMVFSLIPATAPLKAFAEDEWQYDPAPTCTSPGTGYRFSAVGTVETKTVPALGHSFGEWIVTEPPGCTYDGTRVRTCTRCGEQEWSGIPATGHNFSEWYTTVWPSCTQIGYQERTCSYCGTKETRSTGYGDHNWGSWYVMQDATCYQQGINARTCQNCGETETYYTGYGNHSWGSWYVYREATCTQQGINARECWNCGEMESYYTGYADHSFGAWEVTKEATDFSAGIRSRFCAVCGEEEQESFDPAGTLRKGDQGDAVAAFQQGLNDAGYDCGAADGDFGPNTEKAVIAFEVDHDMEGDGVGWPGVQKAVLHGKFSLPKTDYYLTLGHDEPRVSTVGDNEMDKIAFEVMPGYQGFEDCTDVKITYLEYRGLEDESELLAQGIVPIEGDNTLKAGEEWAITMETYADRPACGMGGVHYFITVTGKVKAEDEVMDLSETIRLDLPLMPLPAPVGMVLPETTPGSSAIILLGSYDEEKEWKENDIVPIELSLINIGQVPVSSLNLDASLRKIGYGNDYWKENVYKDLTDITLNPGEKYTYTYNYVVRDAKPELKDDPFLYFGARAIDVNNLYVYAGYTMKDPLYPSTYGVGTAAIVLNGAVDTEYPYQAGDEIEVELTVINVGDSDLEDICFFVNMLNKNGTQYEFIPSDKDHYYLSTNQEYKTTFKHKLTQEEIDAGELTFEIVADAKIAASKILGGLAGGSALAQYRVKVPFGKQNEPALNLSYFVTQPEVPFKLGQEIPVQLHVEGTEAFQPDFQLIEYPYELCEDDTNDLAGNLPVGSLGAGEPLDFTAVIKVQPEDILNGYVSRFFIVEGEAVSGEIVDSNEVEVYLSDGFPEFEADVKPYLTVTLADATKPFYKPGEPVALNWKLENQGKEDGYFGGVYIITASEEGYTRTELVPGDASTMAGGDVLEGSLLVPAPNTKGGMAYLMFDAMLLTWEPDLEEHYSNVCVVPVPVAGEGSGLFLEMIEKSEPANKMFYVEGEEVEFLVNVYNPQDEDFYNLDLYGAAMDASFLFSGVVPPAGDKPSLTGSVKHFVTLDDCWEGKYEECAAIYYEDKEKTSRWYYSVPQSVVCGFEGDPEIVDPAEVHIYKGLGNAPKNGSFYQEGETIEFVIQVWNSGEVDAVDVYVTDTLNMMEMSDVAYIDELFPMSYREYIFKHVVTKEDVERGYVINTASASWMSKTNIGGWVISEPVVVDTDGNPDPIDIIIGGTAVTFPSNQFRPNPPEETRPDPGERETRPEPPTEDETLETIVDRETDPNPPTETETQPEETLPEPPTETETQPEETLPEPPTETETQPEETLPEPPTETVPETEETLPEPPTVTVPETEVTLPEPPTVTVPETEETLPEPPTQPEETKPEPPTQPEETQPEPPTQPEETKPGDNPPEPPTGKPGPTPVGYPGITEALKGKGEASCYHDLQKQGDATTVYEVHYCRYHDLVRQIIEDALAQAKTPEEELIVWQQARALWQQKLNEMYDELLAEAALEKDEEIRKQKEEIIKKEKEAYYLQLTSYEADLQLLYPEDQLTVAMKVADQIRYRTMDMCYEISNAPKSRVDSILKKDILFLPDQKPGEECGSDTVRLTNGNYQLTEFFDEDHATVRNTVLEMAKMARDYPDLFLANLDGTGIVLPTLKEGEEMPSAITLVWQRSRALWKNKLDVITTKRYLAADKAGREVITASRATFVDYLKAREELLDLLYEDEPDIREEVLSYLTMNRVLRFCESIAEVKKAEEK